jgi:acyl dehydratase
VAARRFPVEAGHVLAFSRALGLGLTGQAIAALVGTESLLRFGVRFTAQVWPGDTLTVRSSVVRIFEDDGAPVAEFSVSTVNAEGREVLSGYAHTRLAS